MKVYIGPYAYNHEQLDLFLTEYETSENPIVNVDIDKYDTWSMDHTLAYIVLPMLKQLRDTKHGAPKVDNSDVPEHLRSKSPDRGTNVTEFYFERWNYVMDEMIFAFENKVDDSWQEKFWYCHPSAHDTVDIVGMQEYQDRISNGFRLFGKYYEALWD